MADTDTMLKLLVLRELLSSNSEDNEESSPKNGLLDVGLKVVRGPSWSWENQDDGEGHIGTIVEVGKTGSSSNKTVVVQWDGGLRKNYRVGLNNFYDLCALDNASLGVTHPTVTCNSCRKKGVIGMRWKCKWCYDYDLCNSCYMSDKHDISHPFERIQINNGPKVSVPRRQISVKIQMKGILSSAKVVRSTDWRWDNQDGGSGKTGIVQNICGWNDTSDFCACHVSWSATDTTNLYRIGYEGKMDLKYVQDAVDGYYYRDHLPIIGDEQRTVSETTSTETLSNRRSSEPSTNRQTVNKPSNETGSDTSVALLSQNLKDLFYSDQFSDLTILVKGKKFEVHKAIISARSSLFASKIQFMKSSSLEIKDCEPDIFEDVLFYLYTGKLKRLSHANVNALYRVADKLEIMALKKECLRFKSEGLSADHISEFVAVA